MAEGSSRGGFATAPLFDPEPRGKNAHADRKPHLEEKPNSAEHASSFFWGRTDEVDGGISGRGHRHKRPGPKPEETPVIQTFRHGSQLVRKGRERLDAEAQGSRKHAGIQKPRVCRSYGRAEAIGVPASIGKFTDKLNRQTDGYPGRRTPNQESSGHLAQS